ncbi:MAG: 23S rRNA (adenine(2503)-C(2))-methyltransferase RlmN [Pseudomonadota bacterium]
MLKEKMNPQLGKIDLRDMTLSELNAWVLSLGLERFRGKQLFRWLSRRDVESFDQMTNLKKDLRLRFSEVSYLGGLNIRRIDRSLDGTRKFLFGLDDGESVESVLIPERDHFTLCISSQVGCAMGCRFCLTGRNGFKRNLRASEIVNQVRTVQICLEAGERLTNLVFMGMGEPLLNYENLIRSLQILLADEGFGFSSRKTTVSTCGIVPRIEQLGKDVTVSLAVSLHAPDNETRSLLMPVNKTYPIERLLDACRKFPLPQRRMITFEYLLIEGVNDRPEQARALARLLRGIRAKINLIPFNSYPGSEFIPSSPETVLTFQSVLIENHYTTIIRESKGSDILAACGQLHSHARD